MTIQTPKLKIQRRTPNAQVQQRALEQGLHPLLARIIASRPQPEQIDFAQLINPKLSVLDHPLRMRDMQKAAQRVAQAIMQGEVIGIETDHDCDGQTSHAVLFYNLIERFKHPAHLVRSYIGHRLTEGYGLSMKVAQRILQDETRPSLIITADNGSADEERIALLAANNIQVIVTDHHQLPIAGAPASAFACLNPTRVDCEFPDPYIAGCMVAWLLMAATRLELISQGYLSADAAKLTDSLDFVAVGTVADCVSMARSINNRAIVNYGLKLINQGLRPCWRAAQKLSKEPLTATDLGFKIGPLLNSDGRLASAFGSVSFLLADDDTEAEQWIAYLQEQNQQRKSIQNTITQQGMVIAAEQTALNRFSLCIFLAQGHSGVHGISASRIKESFGRPTVFLAPKQGEENIVTGSIRGIEGFHVGNAIQWIITQTPELLIAGGGHAGAGGVTLHMDKLPAFSAQFELAVQQQMQLADLGPVLLTDGELPADWLNINTLDLLAQLEPFGREFDAPVFEATATLEGLRPIGDGTHARLSLVIAGKRLNGVWFGFRNSAQDPIEYQTGQNVHCMFTLQSNNFSGERRCEVQIVYLQPF